MASASSSSTVLPQDAIRAIAYTHAMTAAEVKILYIQKPVPRPDEVLIEVHAFGLNYADVLARQGLYPDAPSYPFVPGYEVAGVISAIGDDCVAQGFELRVGDRVVALTLFGGYAEFAVARHIGTIKIPDSMSFVEAASLPVNCCTAYHSLFNTGTLLAGDRVLIHAAAGGVGQIAVQLAKNRGCEVFATAGSDTKLNLLQNNFGVDHAINYNTSDFAATIRTQTGSPTGGCLDLILDSLGGSQLKSGMDLLKPNGRVVSIGVSSISDRYSVLGFFSAIPKVFSMLTFNAIDMLRYSKTFCGVNMLAIAQAKPLLVKQSIAACLDLIAQGKLRTVVSQQYDWSEVGRAHTDMEQRRTTGKIVFTISRGQNQVPNPAPHTQTHSVPSSSSSIPSSSSSTASSVDSKSTTQNKASEEQELAPME